MNAERARKQLSEAARDRQKAQDDLAKANARIVEILREIQPGRDGKRDGLSMREAAEIIGVSPQALYDMLR